MNPDELKDFQETFDKLKKDWLSEKEQTKLEELFKQMPRNKQEEFLAKKENLQEPLKSFIEWLKTKMASLKEDVEKNPLKWGFEELKNSFENSEVSKEFFELVESYIDLKLAKWFSRNQKDKIKLALLWEIESGFNISSIWEWLLNKVLKPLKQKIDKLKSGNFDETTSVDDIPWFSDIQNSMEEMFSNFWLDLKVKELDEKIKKINEEKETWEISDLKSVLNIINPDNVDSINFDTIKAKTEKIVWILDKWRTVANQVKNWLEKLPFGLGEIITNWIKSTIKEGWFLWMILWFFFWKEFMDESAWKQKQSLTNLEKYSKTENFPLSENIKTEEIQTLDPKQLEKFYKYLDTKNIDYSKENFWEGLLTWKTKDKKILEIYELLKNSDWKVLTENDKLDDLVKKLNSLEELESKKEQQNLQKEVEETQEQVESWKKDLVLVQKQRQELETQAKKAEEQLQETTSEEEKKKIEEQLEQARKKAEELKKQEEEKQRELKEAMEKAKKLKEEKDFKESVNNITKLPAEIIYKWEKLTLNIENNQIVLGKDRYKISIMAETYWERFKKIEFVNWNFILNRDKWDNWTIITKSQVIKLIPSLLVKWNFSLNWVKKNAWLLWWDVNYKLAISKA